jgi:hypothetical protein
MQEMQDNYTSGADNLFSAETNQTQELFPHHRSHTFEFSENNTTISTDHADHAYVDMMMIVPILGGRPTLLT